MKVQPATGDAAAGKEVGNEEQKTIHTRHLSHSVEMHIVVVTLRREIIYGQSDWRPSSRSA